MWYSGLKENTSQNYQDYKNVIISSVCKKATFKRTDSIPCYEDVESS